MHDEQTNPQLVKISGISQNKHAGDETSLLSQMRKICLFTICRQYLHLRQPAAMVDEQFFVFTDGSPVCAANVRATLKMSLTLANLDPRLYSCHSWRIGRACDLLSMSCSVETIKKLGGWKSNAAFRYLRT